MEDTIFAAAESVNTAAEPITGGAPATQKVPRSIVPDLSFENDAIKLSAVSSLLTIIADWAESRSHLDMADTGVLVESLNGLSLFTSGL